VFASAAGKGSEVAQFGLLFFPGSDRRRRLEATCSTMASTYAPERQAIFWLWQHLTMRLMHRKALARRTALI
jgi:hypothetical protein